MKRRIISMVLCIIMVTTMIGCGNKTKKKTTKATNNTESTEKNNSETTLEKKESEETDTKPSQDTIDIPNSKLSYKGKIQLMYFSAQEETKEARAIEGFSKISKLWDKSQKKINLDMNQLGKEEYIAKLQMMANDDELPDMFLIQNKDVREWALLGKILDLTECVKNSPYYSRYDKSKFYPFKYSGKFYGIPVLSQNTNTIVIYDQNAWKAAGFETFPNTFKAVKKAKEYFSKQQKDTIAFGNKNRWNVNTNFLSTIADRYTGTSWYHNIVEKKGAKFSDKGFVKALKFTQDIFSSGVFNKDFNTITNEDAREYYINGNAAAFIGSDQDVAYIGEVLKESNRELYENSKLAVIPQPDGATKSIGTHSAGMDYAIAFSSKLVEEPEKLEACINLAYQLTGEEYATYIAENYAIRTLTNVKEADMSNFDEYTMNLYNYYDHPSSEIYDSFLNGAVWEVLNKELYEMVGGKKNAKTVATDVAKECGINY